MPRRISEKEKRQREKLRNEYYERFKKTIPYIYDWFTYHSVRWPSQSCRWGPQIRQTTYKNVQRLYLSEQTNGRFPYKLIIADFEIVKPRVAAAQNMTKFDVEESSPFAKGFKTIIHPGEVNRIRELPKDNKIVATHTDGPDVLIWDVESQPNRDPIPGATQSRPDLILTGHQDSAEFALAMCPTEPFVLSGGKDKLVVLWSIHDHISSLVSNQGAHKSSVFGLGTSNTKTSRGDEVDHKANSPTVHARGVFRGHKDTVEDVQFCPSSAQEFCSVGDDSCLMLWDARTGSAPVVKVEKAHRADLHCVDWNPHDVNLILTGSADNSVRMFDRRNLTSGGVGTPVHSIKGHSASVLCVQWSPDKSSVFGSSAEDGIVNLWDHNNIGKQDDDGTRAPNVSPALFFHHAGHRDKVVDFHWNPSDPWTIVSASDDGRSFGAGGTLQIWRISDLIYRPREEVIEEMEKFRSHLDACAP